MAAQGRFKKIEKAFAKRVAKAFRRVITQIGMRVSDFFMAGRQKMTVMLVPHSEKRIVNIQISLFGLAALFIVSFAAIGLLVYSTAGYGAIMSKLAGKTDSLRNTQENLDAIRDSTSRLVKAAGSFQMALDSTLSTIGIRQQASESTSLGGDLSAFFSPTTLGSGGLRETSEIEKVCNYLERSVQPLQEIGKSVTAQGAILSEIPNIWPIKGGIGHISAYYGQNEHPIYGNWYIHKGIDLSTFRSGDPVLSTADGKVIAVAYDMSLGNYIIIEHKHGFITRYAHLSAFKVQKGMLVKQGQIIGYIGNSGLSTGAHLHYEVHLGTETIDPLNFLNIKSTSAYFSP